MLPRNLQLDSVFQVYQIIELNYSFKITYYFWKFQCPAELFRLKKQLDGKMILIKVAYLEKGNNVCKDHFPGYR